MQLYTAMTAKQTDKLSQHVVYTTENGCNESFIRTYYGVLLHSTIKKLKPKVRIFV